MSCSRRWRLGAGAVLSTFAFAACGGSGDPLPERRLAAGGGEALRLPVRATALLEAGDLDRDGSDDLLIAVGRDDQLFAWTSRRRALTRLVGALLNYSDSGSYPVATSAGGIVLTGARLRWIAPRRTWPAVVRPVVLQRASYLLQGAAAGRNVLIVDGRGRGRIIRTDGARRPLARATRLSVAGGVGASSGAFAFARGSENWLLRGGDSRRLADTEERESAEVIQPFGDRALTVALHEPDGLPDQPIKQEFVARLVDEDATVDSRRLDNRNALNSSSRATRHGLAVIDLQNPRVTLLSVRGGQIDVLAIPNCIGIADKDDGIAILRPNGKVELRELP
jgi:hypothetical protein